MSFQIFLILSIRFSRCNPDFHPSRRFPLRNGSGNHLFSRIVSNTVPSADMVFTVVFGMGTGVTPYRIATGNIWLFNNVRAGNFTHTPNVLLRLTLSSVVHSFVQETSPYSNRLAPRLASLAAWRPVAFLISVFLFLNPCMQACSLSKQKSCCTHFNNWTVMQTLLIPLERR